MGTSKMTTNTIPPPPTHPSHYTTSPSQKSPRCSKPSTATKPATFSRSNQPPSKTSPPFSRPSSPPSSTTPSTRTNTPTHSSTQKPSKCTQNAPSQLPTNLSPPHHCQSPRHSPQ